MIYGLTGGIGSGKSTISKILKKYGFIIIDADKISRETVKKGSKTLDELTKAFGSDILCSCGRLNRKKLASIAFCDDKAYKTLNKITSSAILTLAKEKIEKHKGKDIIFEVPLLFESSWDRYCDKTITVCASEKLRTQRVSKRDHISEKQIKERINRQLTDKERKEKADIVIYNNGELDKLEKQLVKALNLKG